MNDLLSSIGGAGFALCFCLTSLACAQAEPEPETTAAASSVAKQERMVMSSASIRIEAGEPAQVAQAVKRIAEAYDGYILSSELRSEAGESRRFHVTLQVPEVQLDEALTKLGSLGKLLQQQTSGQDVTEEFVDVSARLKADHTLEARLLAMTTEAGSLKDILEVERELTRVRSEIESKEGRLRYLREKSHLATIHLTVSSPFEPLVSNSKSIGSQFAIAFTTSAQVGGTIARWLIVSLGALLPFALAGALGFIPYRALQRTRRRLLGKREVRGAAA